MKNYLRFLYTTSFQKWSIYLAIALYALVGIIVFFVIPAAMKANVVSVVQMSSIMSMFILIGAISASTIAVELFRDGIENGSEIIIFSKPLRRTHIIWSKIIVMLTIILLISALTMVLALFSGLSYYKAFNVGLFGAGALVASWIIFIFFGSIGIFASLFLKKVGTILITTGFAVAMMLYTFITGIITTSPAAYFNQNSISVRPITLLKKAKNEQTVEITKQTQTNKVDYSWHVLALLNKKILTSETPNIFNPNKPVAANLQIYLKNYWSHAVENKFWLNIQYMDLNTQFTSLFNLSVNRFFNSSLSNYFTQRGKLVKSYLYQFVPVNNSLNDIKSDYLSKNGYMNILSQYPINDRNIPVNPVPGQTITLQPTTFLLTINSQSDYDFVNNLSDQYGQRITKYALNKTGQLDFLEQINLPSWENNLTEPYILKQNTYITTDPTSLNNFVNTYYSPTILNTINELNLQAVNNLQKYASYYATYFFMQALYDAKTETFKDFLKLNPFSQKDVMKKFNESFYDFQYLTFLALQQQKNLTYNNDLNKTMMFVLGLPNSYQSNQIKFLAANPNIWKNFLNPANEDMKNKTYEYLLNYQPPLELLNSIYFQTLNNVNPYNIYNVGALVGSWIVLSLAFMMISLAFYAKKDFA